MENEDHNLKQAEGQSSPVHHHGERVRVRKRIRVKKKKSPRKKIRKFMERVVWLIILVAFLLTLVYLLKELDLTDARYKKKKTSLIRILPDETLFSNAFTPCAGIKT